MMICPSKNIALFGNLIDLFLSLTRLSSCLKSGEYSSIRLWADTPSLERSRELTSLNQDKVEIFGRSQMQNYLESIIPLGQIVEEREFFLPSRYNDGQKEKFNIFMSRFFPSMENWTIKELVCGYNKEFPFMLNVKKKELESPYVVVIPFCSIKFGGEEPKSEFSKWATLVSQIRNLFPELKIVILGDSSDKVNRDNERISKETIDLRGKLSVEEEISYIYGSFLTTGVFSFYTLVSLFAGIPTCLFSQVTKSISKYAFPDNFDRLSFSKILFDEDEKVTLALKRRTLLESLCYANDNVSRRT